MSNKKMNDGQSIFEVVVAIALISLVLVALVSMASLSIAASTFSRNQTQATRFTQQGVEWLRAEKEANWNTFRTRAATPNWCLDSLYWSKPVTCSSTEVIAGTVFRRRLGLTINADSTVTAVISTSWVDARGTHTIPTSIVFANTK